ACALSRSSANERAVRCRGPAYRGAPGARAHALCALGYLDFLALEAKAAFVLTDSGVCRKRLWRSGSGTSRFVTQRSVPLRSSSEPTRCSARIRIGSGAIPRLLE